jgi:hypothetical protein
MFSLFHTHQFLLLRLPSLLSLRTILFSHDLMPTRQINITTRVILEHQLCGVHCTELPTLGHPLYRNWQADNPVPLPLDDKAEVSLN